jgi:hypothetical protein
MPFQLFQAPANMNIEFSSRAPHSRLERFKVELANLAFGLTKLLKYLDLFYFSKQEDELLLQFLETKVNQDSN